MAHKGLTLKHSFLLDLKCSAGLIRQIQRSLLVVEAFSKFKLSLKIEPKQSWHAMQGPTLTMKIHEYSLIREVVASQQRPRQPDSLWKTSPLVVMNNFSGQEQLKLATVLFQNLFPPINVQSARLSACQVKPSYSYQLI